MRKIGSSLLVLLAATLWGCGGSNPQPISSQDFYSHDNISESPFSTVDNPGALPPREPHAIPSPPIAPTPPPSHGISESIQQAFPPPSPQEAPTTQPLAIVPTTQPSTQPAALATSAPTIVPYQYMTLGTVVAKVDGTPIYANKVLQRDATVLRDLAREYDIQRFQTAARDRIDKTTHELIYDQLEYAAAERELDSDHKNMAQALTQQWRQRMITQAGGSLEVARRRSAAQGEDFNDRVQDEHRYYMVVIYQMEKIHPQVQVTAADMRRYYQAHLQSEFSKPDKATVLIIHTDPSDLGDDLAQTKIQDFRSRAIAGEDFAALAKLQSSNIFWQPRTIERGSFALTNVESAIWKMSPGSVSDTIQDNGGYYLVKLISIDKGGVTPFEDEAVQDGIHRVLESQQLQDLEQQERMKLLENAVVIPDPPRIDATLDMAMQNYAFWAKQ